MRNAVVIRTTKSEIKSIILIYFNHFIQKHIYKLKIRIQTNLPFLNTNKHVQFYTVFYIWIRGLLRICINTLLIF